jgi:DNA-directed RNA polymerase specialized sigma24 family protein
VLDPLLQHESAFRAFLRRRLNDKVVAEDVLQQSLLRAVEREHKIHDIESVVAWFYCINAMISERLSLEILFEWDGLDEAK